MNLDESIGLWSVKVWGVLRRRILNRFASQWWVFATAAGIALIFSVVSSLLGSSHIGYLRSYDGIPWILFPAAINPATYPIADQSAVFSREFHLEQVPAVAVLEYRAFSRGQISLNGHRVPEASIGRLNWKEPRRLLVSERLVSGANKLEIEVTHDTGPPAAWFVLRCGEQTYSSDSNCRATLNGSLSRQACTAETRPAFRPGHPLEYDELTLTCFATGWKSLLLLLAVSVAVVLLAERCLIGGLVVLGKHISREQVFGIIIVLPWIALFILNSQSLTVPIGFDVDGHVGYINHIRTHWIPPLPGEHWEAHQPPVYYVIMAALLTLLGTPTESPTGLLAIRAVAFLFGLVQVALIAATLKQVLGECKQAIVAGTLLAAALPLHLLQVHSVSNDLLAATFSSAAILISLRILQDVATSTRTYCLLGGLLGLAILTKLTALPLAAMISLFILGHALYRDRGLGTRATRLASMFIMLLIVSGWFFVRNYWNYGRLLVGNYDSISGFKWWQDPGYTTWSQWTTFGHVFSSPYHATILHGFLDGVYSTLWGDGGWAGGHRSSRPPWNYELMSAGYLMALVPTLLIIAGGARSAWQQTRQPSWSGALLLCGFGAQCLALCYFVAGHPYFGCMKALYLLPVVPMLCVWGGMGFDWFSRTRSPCPRVVALLLCFWAIVSLMSVCIWPSSAETLVFRGQHMLWRRQVEAAQAFSLQAVSQHPSDARGWKLFGETLLEQGNDRMAAEALHKAVRQEPALGEARVGLATALYGMGDLAGCDRELRNAIEQSPDFCDSYVGLALRLIKAGNTSAGIQVLRAGLCVAPTNIDIHQRLGDALLEIGNTTESIRHYRDAIRFQAESPAVLLRLAWLLCATEEMHLRDVEEALRLVEQAAASTEPRDELGLIRVRAAVLAARGRFIEAITVIDHGRKIVAENITEQAAQELAVERMTYARQKQLQLTASEIRSRLSIIP